MKNMKKIVSMLLALCLVLSMGTVAFAASGNNADTGSITIDKAHVGATYTIYQILILDSYDTSINSYIYSIHEDWEDFVKNSAYLVVNDNGTVKWNGTATQATAAAFVAEAIAYAEANSIEAVASKVAAEGEPVKFENLNLGYYLVDSSIGALCSIDTVMPDTIIEEKNLVPPVDKKVQDHEGNWQESISSRIGKVENFAAKITVYAGTENLVYHDVMDSTLDYVEGSVLVYYTPMVSGKLIPAVDETDPENPVTNYTVVENPTDGCTFEVRFTNEFMAKITQATDITIVYQAALTEDAVIAGDGNVNKAKLTFGDDGITEWDEATIYTYQFGIVKTDISNHVLIGAEFDLYYSATGNDQIALVEAKPDYEGFVEVEGVNYYRPATDAEKAAEGFVSAKIKAGKACVWGIRSGVAMYLEETKAPDGYNPLSERYHITALQNDNNNPVFSPEGLYVSGGVEVENLAGAQLPQTGGIGTTLFYVFGSLLAAGAVILLVTKKRMSV